MIAITMKFRFQSPLKLICVINIFPTERLYQLTVVSGSKRIENLRQEPQHFKNKIIIILPHLGDFKLAKFATEGWREGSVSEALAT